jgi:hypothetical protein
MTSLRTRSTPSSAAPAQGAEPDLRPPPAVRAGAAGWRDPRLVVGVVIVAGCVLLGARVFATADDTVAVWSVRTDLPAGSRLSGDDLAAVQVRIAGSGADRYLLAGTAPSPGSTLVRDLDAGELLPRSAVASSGAPDLLEVPLSVAPDDVPGSVRPGAIVDVWVTPTVAVAGDPRPRARLVLDGVIVVAVPSGGDSLAPRTTRQVIVGVDESRSGEVAEALGLMADGRIVLIRQSRP